MTSSTICSDKDIWQVKWPRPSLRWWWHPSSGSKCCYWYSIPAKVVMADKQYKGTLDCVSYPQEIWILSFWHGTLVDVIRNFPTQTLNFFFKDKCHQIFLGSVDNSAQFWFLLCRGVCINQEGALRTLLIFTHLFSIGLIKAGAEREFRDHDDCLVKIWKFYGITSLYEALIYQYKALSPTKLSIFLFTTLQRGHF